MVFFFSYARNDAEMGKGCLLEEFYRDLDSRIGARLAKNLPCSYKDTKMDTGVIWPKAQIQALQKCPLLVFILSPYYQSSNFGGKELAVYLQRSEQMRETFPHLPNLIFPVRWIPLRDSKIQVPDSINDLNSSNYGMKGDIMKDGLKLLIENDPNNYNKFLNGLVNDMLDALHKLEKEAPDYLSSIPPVESIKSVRSAFDFPNKEPPPPPPPHIPLAIWLASIFSLILAASAVYWFALPTKPKPCCSNNCLESDLDTSIPPNFPDSTTHPSTKLPAPHSPLIKSGVDAPLTFATGAYLKSFSKLLADINAVCGESILLKELFTTGGRDNLMALASKNADLGPAGVDVYHAMKGGNDGIAKLKALVSLPTDLLHIVVSESGYQMATGSSCSGFEIFGKCINGSWNSECQTKFIQTEKDLHGLTVATIGSAQIVAESYLNSKLDMNLKIIDVVTDSQAFSFLKAGKVQAVLTLAAFPSGTIQALNPKSGFTLANWKSGATGVYTITMKGYENIGCPSVSFLSSQILLMVRPIEDHNGKIGRRITRLKSCLIAKLPELKDGAQYQQAWADIKTLKPPDDIPVW